MYKNTSLLTLLNKDFEIAFYVMLKSLIDSNPDFCYSILVLHNSPLSDDFEEKSKSIYSNILLEKIEAEKYNDIQVSNTSHQYRENYFKFEAFMPREYDSVVFMDADTIILKDISDMFEEFPNKYELAAVKDTNLDQFNTGVMFVNKPFMDKDLVKELIKVAAPGDSINGDQTPINTVLGGLIEPLPMWYNCLKTDFRHVGSWLSRTKILHYVSKKPWQQYDSSIHYPGNLECSYAESIWFKIRNTLPF